jgi:hypothetical protein
MEKERVKKEVVSMEFATFDIPPAGDVLVLGKRSPMGPQAAKKMLDTVAPGQFELVQSEDDFIEAILIKKCLFSRTEKEPLIKAIVEESKAIMDSHCMVRIKSVVPNTPTSEVIYKAYFSSKIGEKKNVPLCADIG